MILSTHKPPFPSLKSRWGYSWLTGKDQTASGLFLLRTASRCVGTWLSRVHWLSHTWQSRSWGTDGCQPQRGEIRRPRCLLHLWANPLVSLTHQLVISSMILEGWSLKTRARCTRPAFNAHLLHDILSAKDCRDWLSHPILYFFFSFLKYNAVHCVGQNTK